MEEQKNGNGASLVRAESKPAQLANAATTVRLDSWADVVRFAEAMSRCPVGIIPKAYAGNAPSIAAAVMMGAEIGIHAMESLRSIYVVDGKPQLSAELMLKVAMRNGVTIQWIERSDKLAHARFTRPGHPPHEEKFSWADAERAGLANKDTFRKYPKAMLSARCVSSAMRAWAPDAIGAAGFYVEGEIEGDAREAPARTTIEVVHEPELAPAPPKRTPVSSTTTVAEFRAWCEENAQAVVDSGPKGLAKVIAHGAKLGPGETVVRQWLGIEPPAPPREHDDGSLAEDPPG